MDSQQEMWMLLESSGFCLPINLASITWLKSISCLCLSFSTFYLHYYRQHVVKIFELFMLAFLLSFLPSVNICAEDVFMNWERTFRFFGKHILFEKQFFVFFEQHLGKYLWYRYFLMMLFWKQEKRFQIYQNWNLRQDHLMGHGKTKSKEVLWFLSW